LFHDVDRAKLMTNSERWDGPAVYFRTTDTDQFYTIDSDSEGLTDNDVATVQESWTEKPMETS
jgi:hypothetical protein